MSYIGKTPTVGNFIKLDDITTSSTNSYTLQHNSVNFSPESALHMMVSLNGVIQAPNTSYTVSGSTITFLPSSGTLSSSDSIDFIMVYGNVLDVGVATTVSDSSITKAKMNLISDSSSAGLTIKGDGGSENGTLQLNCSQNSHGVKVSSPAHSSGQSYEMILPTTNITAGKFLKVDSVSGSGATGIGQLSFADAGGITVADQYRYTANTGGISGDITANLERVDSDFDKIGTGITNSSGIFSFPSTGIYLVQVQAHINFVNEADNSSIVSTFVTTNNSSYNQRARAVAGSNSTSNNSNFTVFSNLMVDVTDTSNVKVKFVASSFDSQSYLEGDTDKNQTSFTFIRLGDT